MSVESCLGCLSVLEEEGVPLGHSPDFSIKTCERCGLAHLRPLPSGTDPYQMKTLGDHERAMASLEKGFQFHHGRLWGLLRNHIPARPCILEIGCGSGDFLNLAHRNGAEVWAIEPAQGSAHLASRGIRLLKGSIETTEPPSNYFDAAVAVQVIEHLRNPSVLIEKMASALKPGGVLYVETPNYGALLRHWRRSGFVKLNLSPGHWHLFRKKSLTHLLRRCGVRPLRTWTFFKGLGMYNGGRHLRLFLGMLNAGLGPLGWANTLATVGRVEK